MRRAIECTRRSIEIRQPIFGDLTEPHRVCLIDIRRQRIDAIGKSLVEQRRELAPQVLGLGEAHERHEQLGVVRIIGERAPPHDECLRGLVRDRLARVREGLPVGAARDRIAIGDGEASLVDADQARRLALGAVDALEDRRRGLDVIVVLHQRLERRAHPRAPARPGARRRSAGSRPRDP